MHFLKGGPLGLAAAYILAEPLMKRRQRQAVLLGEAALRQAAHPVTPDPPGSFLRSKSPTRERIILHAPIIASRPGPRQMHLAYRLQSTL
jgi:hypothetical protein